METTTVNNDDSRCARLKETGGGSVLGQNGMEYCTAS